MTPLLFAAALVVSPVATQPSQPLVFKFHFEPPSPAVACAKLLDKTVAPDGVPFRKLNELPPGLLEHAVLRSVNGCPVRELVYGGQAYYVGPAIGTLEKGPDVGSRIQRRDLAPDKAPDHR